MITASMTFARDNYHHMRATPVSPPSASPLARGGGWGAARSLTILRLPERPVESGLAGVPDPLPRPPGLLVTILAGLLMLALLSNCVHDGVLRQPVLWRGGYLHR